MPSRIKVGDTEARWQTLPELLDGIAATAAPEAGVDVDGRFLNYRDLARMSRHLAAGLSARGIGKGDRVCSLLHNRIEALVVFFGVTGIGGVWVPVNVGLMGQDLAHVLRDAGPVAGRGLGRRQHRADRLGRDFTGPRAAAGGIAGMRTGV